MPAFQMSDEDWRRYRNYADRVTVVITPLEWLGAEDAADEDWVIVTQGAAWDQDWLVQQVFNIATVEDPDRVADHELKVRETHLSWGADGAGYEILLALASWAASSAAWDATKALGGSLRDRLGSAYQGDATTPLTEHEAEQRAHWVLQSRYKENATELTLTSIELRPPNMATVGMVDVSGWRYECDLVLDGNLVSLARIKRHKPSG